MQVNVSITGLQQVMDTFNLFQTEAAGAAAEAVLANLQAILADAQELCPVNTGNLRDSLAIDFQPTSSGASGSVYTNVYYAEYVEFGTVHMAAEPFLTPAFEANSPMLMDDFEELIQELVP